MKKIPFLIALITFSGISFSQTKMFINKVDGTSDSVSLSQIKSITFKTSGGVIPTQSLVAYYPFNGNANDESGNGNSGTTNGARLDTDRFGNANKAYSFNGTSNYIQVQPSTSLDFSRSFTISVWSRKIGHDEQQGSLVATGGTACYGGFVLQHRNNGVRYEYQDNNFSNWCLVFADTTLGTEDGNWHHFVYIVDGSLKIANGWVDGNHIISSFDLTSEANITSSHPVQIGKLNGSVPPSPQYFYGSIDDIRIYNRALSDSEIRALYHEGGW